MALGKRCSSMKLRHAAVDGEEGLGFEFVRYTRSFGRKRIVISNNAVSLPVDSNFETPLKRLCSGGFALESPEPEKSSLESLPQDILIRILCGVDHEDLKQLFHVSKAIREATTIAKEMHFAYSTPTKTRAFRTSIDFDNPSEVDEIEAPNAPKQARSYKSRLNGRNLTDISVELFASPIKGRLLFMETEM